MLSKNISEFLEDSVKPFSIYDCQRSIPSGIDGFKPSQRKVIYGMLKKYPKEEVKVSVASATIMGETCFHHGDMSATMIKMAQNYVGSNNMPFLVGIGQFGSRISPDAAAPRYIFTKMSDSFRKIFLEVDDSILNHLYDDSTKIEPEYYLPIIPTVLLNGAEGVGTGFACSIMNYSINDLVDAVQDILMCRGITRVSLLPKYTNYMGKIESNGKQVVSTGRYEIINTTTMKIFELPIGVFTIKYREVLNKLEDSGTIKSYVDNSKDDKTEFIVNCPRETLKLSEEQLLSTFSLVGRNTENFTVWNENNKLKKFESAIELVTWFVEFRLKKYDDRKIFLLKSLTESISVLKEKIRFIELYLQNSDKISKTNRKDVEEWLRQENFENISDLLSMSVYNLTKDKIESLVELLKAEETKHSVISKQSGRDMYLSDLKTLKNSLR